MYAYTGIHIYTIHIERGTFINGKNTRKKHIENHYSRYIIIMYNEINIFFGERDKG